MLVLVHFSDFYPMMTRPVPHVEAALECRVDTSTGFLLVLPASSQPVTDPALATYILSNHAYREAYHPLISVFLFLTKLLSTVSTLTQTLTLKY